MPIRNCPFTQLSAGDIPRPLLPIIIINSDTKLSFPTWGIIDTGADECAFPADVAPALGHNLKAGAVKSIVTGAGKASAYAHTTTIEILHPVTMKSAYTIQDTPIDFIPKLTSFLLGVNSFLSKFILNIDYPNKVFSIQYPPRRR